MLLKIEIALLPDELLEIQMYVRMRVPKHIQWKNFSPLTVYLGIDELVHLKADVDHCHKDTNVSYK